jgi:RimJ/RimL family protein N-acetyltransferase
MKQMRLAARRWPWLRKLVEVDLMGATPARQLYRRLGKLVYGEFSVERDRNPERLFGVVASEGVELDLQLVKFFEEQLAEDNILLFSARSSRRGLIGNVALNRMDLEDGVSTGYVSAFRVSLGARGLGVGRMLLAAVERSARDNGWKRLVSFVSIENVRSRGLFEASGYSKEPDADLTEECARKLGLDTEGRVMLARTIRDIGQGNAGTHGERR